MLTSSDAKWRCMWHMLVWSILLTLVSQFLSVRDHYAFYILGGVSVFLLPALTALYSNSAGRRGAGALRAGYVLCDPVLACVTITPVQMLNNLPIILDTYYCLSNYGNWNESRHCLENKTSTEEDVLALEVRVSSGMEEILNEKKKQFLVVQGCLVVPVLISLLMGRRTPKMMGVTFVTVFGYWLIVSIEAAELLETALLSKRYEHVIFTTEAIVSIVMILSNSYAVVTLCSYLSPAGLHVGKHNQRKFELIYIGFVGMAAMFFCEMPLLIAKFQILLTDVQKYMHGTFYMWIIKDFLFMGIILFLVVVQKLESKYAQLIRNPCRTPFLDNPDVLFQPEKRDVYIQRRRGNQPPGTTVVTVENCHQVTSFTKLKVETDLPKTDSKPSPSTSSASSTVKQSPPSEKAEGHETPKSKKKVTFQFD